MHYSNGYETIMHYSYENLHFSMWQMISFEIECTAEVNLESRLDAKMISSEFLTER